MTTNNDGALPARYQTGDARDNNGLAEDGATSRNARLSSGFAQLVKWVNLQGITDSAIGREPHCRQALSVWKIRFQFAAKALVAYSA